MDTLISFLSYMGFSGRAIAEGRSPFSGKDGQRVAANTISIYDDALSPLMSYRGPNGQPGLHQDDRAWISWLYPSNDGSTGTIRGTDIV